MSGRTRLCFQPWNTINVGADGNVYPCCVTTDELVIGHLLESPLEEIIRGPRMAAIRDQIVTGNLKGPCEACQNAGMTSVKALNRTLNNYLATTAAETGRHDRLVLVDACDKQFHSIGLVATKTIVIPGEDEEIEVHSGFSSTSYLEGNIHLHGDFTIGLWVNFTESNEASMILHYAAPKIGGWHGPALEVLMGTAPSNLFQIVMSLDGYAQTVVFGAPSRGEGQWTHLVLTKKDDPATLVLNGELAATATVFAESLYNPNAIMRIGVNSAPRRGSRFAGSVAGLFIEQEPLSSDVLGQVYRAEYPAFQ